MINRNSMIVMDMTCLCSSVNGLMNVEIILLAVIS